METEYKFNCPHCKKEHITTDYFLYWDFELTCDDCGKINFFEGGKEVIKS